MKATRGHLVCGSEWLVGAGDRFVLTVSETRFFSRGAKNLRSEQILLNRLRACRRVMPFRIMGYGFAGLLFVDLRWFLTSCVKVLANLERKSFKTSTKNGTNIDQTCTRNDQNVAFWPRGGGRGTRKSTKL